jgi:hypothetical protein
VWLWLLFRMTDAYQMRSFGEKGYEERCTPRPRRSRQFESIERMKGARDRDSSSTNTEHEYILVFQTNCLSSQLVPPPALLQSALPLVVRLRMRCPPACCTHVRYSTDVGPALVANERGKESVLVREADNWFGKPVCEVS